MKVPPGACDCHVHVFGPAARFAFAARRAYTPPEASIKELLALQKRLGLQRVVIVQPSIYGTDNSCTLDALQRLAGRARGVAVVDAGISSDGLLKMQNLGVRGVRVNLQTARLDDPKLIEDAAAQVAPLGWHVQAFTTVPVLKKTAELPVPLIVDHFGLPKSQQDVAELVHLLRTRNVYVKLSGPHRLPMDPGPVVRALVAANPERCLWGSDWPHPVSGARDPKVVQPFDTIDDAAALERLYGWVGDAALFRKILVDNPARLYDF